MWVARLKELATLYNCIIAAGILQFIYLLIRYRQDQRSTAVGVLLVELGGGGRGRLERRRACGGDLLRVVVDHADILHDVVDPRAGLTRPGGRAGG